MSQHKRYLGDSVYVDLELFGTGVGLVLTTENGLGPPSNRIVLEPEVYAELVRYVASIKVTAEQHQPPVNEED
jgi:hypothetical protein